MASEIELQILLDKQQIHEALLRYGMGLDRLNEDLIASAYHDDGIDDHGGEHPRADASSHTGRSAS